MRQFFFLQLDNSRYIQRDDLLVGLLQKQVSGGKYGPTMPELEKQIAEHNILQKEIEAYGLQIKNLHSLVRWHMVNLFTVEMNYSTRLPNAVWLESEE